MSRAGLVVVLVALVTLAALAAIPVPVPGPNGADGASAVAHTFTPPTSLGEDGNRSERAAMRVVENAMIMNGNPDTLPAGCDAVAGKRSVTIRGGVRYAEPGEMFGYTTDRIEVPRCTRLSITFVNEDAVRHQWMVHGLPRETYPMGMFSIEVTGPGRATGTFVTPGSNESLLVHCSLPQHEQKGMLAALVVGSGDGGGGGATTSADATTTGGQPGFGPAAGALALLLCVLLAGWRAT